MANWLLIGGIVGAAIVGSLFFEEGREWWGEVLEYIISFSWLEDIWEFITSIFDGIGDFSIGGLIFALLVVGFIFVLRDYMLMPFLNHMGRVEYLVWGGATYLSAAIGGYIVGNRLFSD